MCRVGSEIAHHQQRIEASDVMGGAKLPGFDPFASAMLPAWQEHYDYFYKVVENVYRAAETHDPLYSTGPPHQ